MTAEERDRLVTGYLTNSLNASERQSLFAAAIEDESLFEELDALAPAAQALAHDDFRNALLDVTQPNAGWYVGTAMAWASQPKVVRPLAVAAGATGAIAVAAAALAYSAFKHRHVSRRP